MGGGQKLDIYKFLATLNQALWPSLLANWLIN